MIAAGYQQQIDWCESLRGPVDAEAFASEAIYVIVNSGMHNQVARIIFERCMASLRAGESCRGVYGHPGKATAIDSIWAQRDELFVGFAAAKDKVAFCGTLPFTAAITKYHLARNLGGDFAKPDVHLNQLAEREGTDAQSLCERLAKASGHRVGTVDMIPVAGVC